MANLWKLNTPQPQPQTAGEPLEYVTCVGRALQPRSDAAEYDKRGSSCKPRPQQTRYTIRVRSKPLMPTSDPDDKPMLSIDQRADTVNVERWSKCDSECDADKIKTSRLSKFSLRPVIVSQGSVKTQVIQDPKAGTLESNPSLLGANDSMESPYLKHQKRKKKMINGFKPLKPVAPQQPSILQCAGITPDPRMEPANHQQGSGRAPVFRRFYEVVVEEPQRVGRRTSRQRSAPDSRGWRLEHCGGCLDERLDTAADSMKVAWSSSEDVQLELTGLCLQRGCGTVGQGRCGSPASGYPAKEACGRSSVSGDSADAPGCVDGLEDYATEDSCKDTDSFYDTKWDPGQLKVTFKLKNSNVLLSFSEKPST
ncbi:uncharacterized protein LOC134015289 [Osmerus eperlanus]|uniref:uncharacterized protein LOC134015289 n=1 Tax=Osmerus eperlanus TaxID=29151 RepID=UPI002E0F473E